MKGLEKFSKAIWPMVPKSFGSKVSMEEVGGKGIIGSSYFNQSNLPLCPLTYFSGLPHEVGFEDLTAKGKVSKPLFKLCLCFVSKEL